MIDTDKYEGHSERIDANEIGEIWEYLADTISEDNLRRAEANYNLAADAPLLLEEFKRLLEQNEYFRGLLDHYKGELIDEHAEVLRLREGIQDALYLFQEAGNPKMSDKKRLDTICDALLEVIE
mgnify:CR=1 FL=1